ncbi:hypothetical protein CEXT_604891 [Caerostris extrusa]|uniref:Uncharacterized protein n=1 Tax=Caerostris extrusa TaxID=172846 RepID=A0AAV4SCL8_CAEEX|nr:hypothetical protein CEXT_604891 [Caerostris extrusa]
MFKQEKPIRMHHKGEGKMTKVQQGREIRKERGVKRGQNKNGNQKKVGRNEHVEEGQKYSGGWKAWIKVLQKLSSLMFEKTCWCFMLICFNV